MNSDMPVSQPVKTAAASMCLARTKKRSQTAFPIYAMAMAVWSCPVIMSGAQAAPAHANAPLPVTAPSDVPAAARIAMERAQQLRAMGAEALIEPQLRAAAEAAPQWIEAQREWARWLSAHQRWRDAATAWRQVIYLKRGDAEAEREFRRARNAAPAIVTTGQTALQSTRPAPDAPSPRYITVPQQNAPVQNVSVQNVPVPQAQNAQAQLAVSSRVSPVLQSKPPVAAPSVAAPSDPLRRMPNVDVDVTLNAQPVRVAQAPVRSTPAVVMQAVAKQSPALVRINPKAAPKVSSQRQADAWPLVERGATALARHDYDRALTLYRQAYNTDPHNTYAQSGIAESLLLLRRYSEAEAAYRAILAVRPNDVKALKGAGDALAYADHAAAALPFYQKAAALQPKSFDALYQLAQAYAWAKQYNTANTYFARALKMQPYSAEAWAKYGESLTYAENPRALSALRRALQIEPNNAPALLGLANLHSISGNYRQAIETYRKLLKVEPRSVPAMIGLGDALTYSDQPEEAIQPYQLAVNLDTNSLPARLGLARALIYAKRYPEGRTQLQRVLQREPQNSEALRLLAMADASSTQRTGDTGYENAIAAYQRLLKTQTAAEERAQTLAAIGDLQIQRGHLDEARTAYTQAMQLAPRDVAIGTNYARSLVYETQWDEAKRVVDEVLRRDPANQQALVLETIIETQIGSAPRAAALARRLVAMDAGSTEDAMLLARALRGAGQPEAAQRVLERLAQRQLETGAPSLELANAIRDAGDYVSAAKLYQSLLRANPNNADARIKLAEMYFYQKDSDAALRELQTVLARDPQNVEANVLSAKVLQSEETTASLAQAAERAEAIASVAPSAAGTITGTNLSLRKQYEEAVKAFQQAVAADPGNAEARINLARNLYYAKRTPEAIAQYQELIQRDPTNSTAKLELAKIYLDQSQLNDAEALYEQVLSGRSTPPAATAPAATAPAATPNVRSNSLISPALRRSRLAQLPDAATPPQTATTAAPANEPTPTIDEGLLVGETATPALGVSSDAQIDALNGLGEIRRRQGRYQEAAQLFRRALAVDSTNVVARLGLARALRGSQDYVTALAETQRVLAVDAGNLTAQVLRAQLLADTGRQDDAQKALDALVSGLPEQPEMETLTDLATAFSDVRNYDAALSLLAEAERLYPDQPYIPRQTAETLRAAGRWDDSIAAYDRLLELDPQDTDALLGKARVYNFSSRLAQAEPLYRQILQSEPDNYPALTELADVLSRNGNWNESIALYRRAVQVNPEDFKTRIELARTLRYNRQYEAAETEINQVLAADPKYVPAFVERGLLRGVQGIYEPGIADLRQALVLAPDDLSAQLALAEVLGYAGQREESIQLYRTALTRDPQNEQARTQLGLVLSYENQYDQALTEIDTVLQQNPGSVTAQLAKADILSRADRVPESIALYNTILTADPSNQSAQLGLAEAYVRSRQYDRGLALYDALLRADPTNAGYRIARGRALGYAQRYSEAAAALHAVVRDNPDNDQARLALAEVLTNGGSNLPEPQSRNEAIAIYRDILQKEPDNYDAQLGLARVYSYTGNYREATRLFNAILEKQPNNEDAIYGLAETQRFNSDFRNAERNYNRVLQMDPANVQAIEGRRLARRETAVQITPFVSLYSDTNNVRYHDYGLSVTVPTSIATIGVTATTGTYEDEGVSFDRKTLGLLLARRFGPIQARLIISRLQYGSAPDRTLYDLLLERTVSARQGYFFRYSKEAVLETLAAVQNGIDYNYYRAGYNFPVGKHVDVELEGRYYDFNDGNRRYTLAPSIYYRLKEEAPTLRIGVGYRREDTDFLSPFYYSPQDYDAFALLADYVVDQGKLRYGLFGSKSLTNSTGTAGTNRPSDTLFGFLNYDLTDALELFANGGIVRGPNFDSNSGTLGLTIRK